MTDTNKNITNLLNAKPELNFIIQVLSDKEIDLSLIEKLDNTEFIRLIKHHRLDSIFYKAVAEQNIELPTELQQKLEQINKQNKMRMMKLTAELIRIHKLFTENSIDYISLKGPALSQQIYGDYTIRSSRDLDILVRVEDLDKVKSLLGKIDYIQSKTLEIRKYHDVLFSNTENNIKLEIHYRFFSNKYLMPIETTCFEMFDVAYIHENKIRVLNKQLSVEYLKLHAEQHLWELLYWIYDFSNVKIVDKQENASQLLEFYSKNKLPESKLATKIIINQIKMINFPKLEKLRYALRLNNTIKYKIEVFLLRIFRLF